MHVIVIFAHVLKKKVWQNMVPRWRVFTKSPQDMALGMKVRREGELWIPEIVAVSHPTDYKRLNHVAGPHNDIRMEISGTRVRLWVHAAYCDLPLTLDDHTAKVRDTVVTEDTKLRAVPQYGKRGTWYKVGPRP